MDMGTRSQESTAHEDGLCLDMTEESKAINKEPVKPGDSLYLEMAKDDIEYRASLDYGGYPMSSNRDPNWIERFQLFCLRHFSTNREVSIKVLVILLLIGYFVYLGFAIDYNYDASIALIVWTSIVVVMIAYIVIRDKYGKPIHRHFIVPISNVLHKYWPVCQWFVYPVLAIVVLVYLVYIIQTFRQLQSLAGMIIFMFIPLITCKYPSQIKWRPVIWGMALQFALGVIVLRTKSGYDAVNFLSTEINKFLMYSLEGAAVAFGNPFFVLHPFFMVVVPLIIYVGAVTAILYYLGIMQAFVRKMGYLMRITLATTGIESVSLALNVFLSVAETILIMKPYIPKLTKSEFHCLLVGSHATIAGWAYALFVLMGVDGQHLLTAAVMSAPAAVAIGKLNFPETDISLFRSEDDFQMESTEESNAIEAMANGAWQAAKTVGNLLVQVIAFISIWNFLDATIAWLGARVGIELSFQVIFSYVFMPLAWLVGIEWHEAEIVAPVLGLKLTANEVLAYLQLGGLRARQEISDKASALTTYAICGFSSFGTLAMFLGVWSTVDPKRVKLVGQLIPRIYMNTNIACFLTACVAGILYDEELITGLVTPKEPPLINLTAVLGLLPGYKELFALVGL